ncbi:hypothetical protein DV735_g4465, partial [Chaetothyriales sp. CBS 134920]
MHLVPTTVLLGLSILSPLVSCSPAQAQLARRDLHPDQAVFMDSGAAAVDDETAVTTIPSRYQSTLLARRLLAQSSVGDLGSVFPANISAGPYWRTPESVASAPIVLPEYIADCERTGDPTLIALAVSTGTKNAKYGDSKNVSITVSWWDEYVRLVGHEPWTKADLPRLALLGHLEELDDDEVEENAVVACFESLHRDARLWRPGSRGSAHSGKWARVRVEEAYWIGGFGDRHYIGWLDIDEWRSVTEDDWKRVRLPGEKL